MTDTQLELSLGNQRVSPSPQANRKASASTSSWWFYRMRQIVDRAFDWQPAPPARPEQIWFPGTHRQMGANS
jgi:hypothetical protein